MQKLSGLALAKLQRFMAVLLRQERCQADIVALDAQLSGLPTDAPTAELTLPAETTWHKYADALLSLWTLGGFAFEDMPPSLHKHDAELKWKSALALVEKREKKLFVRVSGHSIAVGYSHSWPCADLCSRQPALDSGHARLSSARC